MQIYVRFLPMILINLKNIRPRQTELLTRIAIIICRLVNKKIVTGKLVFFFYSKTKKEKHCQKFNYELA